MSNRKPGYALMGLGIAIIVASAAMLFALDSDDMIPIMCSGIAVMCSGLALTDPKSCCRPRADAEAS